MLCYVKQVGQEMNMHMERVLATFLAEPVQQMHQLRKALSSTHAQPSALVEEVLDAAEAAVRNKAHLHLKTLRALLFRRYSLVSAPPATPLPRTRIKGTPLLLLICWLPLSLYLHAMQHSLSRALRLQPRCLPQEGEGRGQSRFRRRHTAKGAVSTGSITMLAPPLDTGTWHAL